MSTSRVLFDILMLALPGRAGLYLLVVSSPVAIPVAILFAAIRDLRWGVAPPHAVYVASPFLNPISTNRVLPFPDVHSGHVHGQCDRFRDPIHADGDWRYRGWNRLDDDVGATKR